MTTNRTEKSKRNTHQNSNRLPVPIFNLQYPHCQTGMFSLRAPSNHFLNQKQTIEIPIARTNVAFAHPAYQPGHFNTSQESPFPHYSNDHESQFQYSNPSIKIYPEQFVVQQRPMLRIPSYDDLSMSPRYRVQFRLQPIQTSIYEVWEPEMSTRRSISLNEPKKILQPPPVRVRASRLVNIQPLSDEENFDQDDRGQGHIVYARCHRACHVPRKAGIVCMRQDAHVIHY